jgi:hypothetical protein
VSPKARKALLAVHLTVSIGWIGGILAYLAIGIAAETSIDPFVIRSSWLAMEIVGWWVLVPQAVLALASGIALALATRWGLLRHYWVVCALALTAICTLVLVLHMPAVSATAEFAREASTAQLLGLGGDLPHPTIGLLLLVAVLVLNIYKPRGLTRRGWRLQQRPGPDLL